MPRLTDPPPVDDPLDDVINAYLEARQAGREPDRRELLQAHPALVDDLERFFAAHDEMERLTRPLRHVAIAARVVGAEGLVDGPGRRLPLPMEFGAYVLLEVLGEGGMGIVYRAHHRLLNRDVALKQILGGPLARASDVERFRVEAEAVAQLQHPNIVAIHDVGEHEDRHYLTMSLIEGGSLADRLGRFRDDPRAAARLMTDVAGAVHHAHERGILHRDLKPSNILLDGDGRPHVTDFGLARRIGSESTLTGSGAVLGSPSYMAPEQAGGRTREITTATDVYGLGAVLYALLTGRPPFRGDSVLETMEQVRSNPPELPRRLNPRVHYDLETIVLKAIAKGQDARYATAKDLADDLRRYLGGEAVLARRPSVFDRTWKWMQRHRALVTAGFATLVVGLLAMLAGFVRVKIAEGKALEAAQIASEEKQKALGAARDSRYESLAQVLLRIIWTPRRRGWSDEAKLATDEMTGIRDDDRLNSLTTAARRGFDAHIADSITPGGSALLFDPTGRRLLVGSVSNGDYRGADRGSTIWDIATGSQRTTKVRGNGPVAFRPDGIPLQLAYDDPRTLRLWDVARETVVGEFTVPVAGHPETDPADRTEPVFFDRALAADGSRVAASIKDPGDRPCVIVWDVASGRLIQRLAGRAPRLAFSPDGRLLAGGVDAGKVHVWSISEGVEVCSPWQGALTINRLAFGRDLRRAAGSVEGRYIPGQGWWLAAGDLGGNVTIWDAETGMLHARYKGGGARIDALGFSGDGTLLAAGGQERIRLWDVATGAPLLGLDGLNECLSVAFSPDGHYLAAGTAQMKASDRAEDLSQVVLWRIENGRGIRTLRGLVTPSSRLRFSPDGRYVGALSSEWKLAVWDHLTGELRHLFEVPEGYASDNASLAFSRDGRRLALSAGDRASLWDAVTGRRLGTWTLPPGLGDLVAFPPSGRLLLFRVETRSGERGPLRDADYRQYPRVGRIRELVDSGRMRMIAEITAFNRHFFNEVAPEDLGYIVADGVTNDDAGEHRAITAFDGETAKPIWSIPVSRGAGTWVALRLDPTGRVLAVGQSQDNEFTLLEMPGGRRIGVIPASQALGPAADTWILESRPDWSKGRVYSLFRRGEPRAVLALATEVVPAVGLVFQFSRDGRRLAWANTDGTVDVAEFDSFLQRVQPVEP